MRSGTRALVFVALMMLVFLGVALLRDRSMTTVAIGGGAAVAVAIGFRLSQAACSERRHRQPRKRKE